MNDFLYTIIQIIVAGSTLLLMRYVLPYLKIKLAKMVSDNLFDEILKAVKSVQQDPDFILGKDKKEEVLVRITAWANNNGIRITQKQLSELIETAVFIMKSEGKNGNNSSAESNIS